MPIEYLTPDRNEKSIPPTNGKISALRKERNIGCVKKLYNFERVYKFMQRIYTTF
jgi:hypothetical protein